MQNRSAIWIFTILLAIACLYSLSFSFFTGSFEKKALAEAVFSTDSVQDALGRELSANETDSVKERYRTNYIRRYGNEELIPFLGYTYYDCQAREIKKGLDLEGGMSVTLEVSIPDMVVNLADNNKSEAFRTAIEKAKTAQESTSGQNFIELFGDAWTSDNEPGKLWNVFHTYNNKEKFPVNSTDEQVLDILSLEAEAAVSNTEQILRTRIDQFGLTQPSIQRQQFTDRILVELPGAKDKERIRELLKSTANLEFWELYTNQEIAQSLSGVNESLRSRYYPEFDAQAVIDRVNNANDTTTAAIDTTDTGVADITELANDDSAEGELSLDEQRKLSPLFSLMSAFVDPQTNQIIPGNFVGLAQKDDRDSVLRMLNSETALNAIPAGNRMKFVFGVDEYAPGVYPIYALRINTKNGKPRLDGASITDARQDFDPVNGRSLVSMSMNPEGAKIWKAMTTEASAATPEKASIAIVLDNKVFSAPQVQTVIGDGRSQITMNNTDPDASIREAVDLANLLKAGALPAPAVIVDEQIIGSTIGKENADKGLISFGIALGVILLFMILYYSGAGGISDIALLANMFFLFGALVSLGASLTLPGIAGIILTIGMAVDANVLIFERIKEELRNGSGKKVAIDNGYKKAYSAILDANITTFATAVVLFLLGSGPIKGFATTLMIGIVTSLFSAIFITRLIISWRMDSKKDVSFYTKMTENMFTNTNFDFIGKRKIFYIISALIIIGGAASLFTRGLDLGVDFSGGRTYDIEFQDEVTPDQVRGALSDAFIDNGTSVPPTVKSVGSSGKKVRITTKFRVDDKSPEVDEQVDAALIAGLSKSGLNNFDRDKVESKKVDPTISDDFQSSSRNAILLSLLVIFLYIVFRFKKKEFGIGALVAMAHDVLVVLGIFSIFYGILPFSMEVDQAFIAAILTVVGYSINDTVVVFDRLREYLAESRRGITTKVINTALNSTLSRTVMTSFSTFIVLLMIFLFGGDSIKGFTFALMIGVIVGTYSSLCIATPLVVDLSKKSIEE